MKIWLNNVSDKNIRAKDYTDKNGKSGVLYSVSIGVPTTISKTGWADVACFAKIAATHKNGTANPGYSNLPLGDDTAMHEVSVCTKLKTAKKPATYKKIQMTSQEIAQLLADNRAAYRAAQKAQAQA